MPVFLSPLVGESEKEGVTLRQDTLTLAPAAGLRTGLSHRGRGKIVCSLSHKQRLLCPC
jgi:hypothetical protein